MVCHYDNENPTVRRAFIFCLYCGLRFCDVKDLTYKNMDYANRLLEFEQNKTKGHSASSGVVIPLNDGLLSIIGEAPADKKLFDIRFAYLRKLLQVSKTLGKKSRNRQTYKLALRLTLVCHYNNILIYIPKYQ